MPFRYHRRNGFIMVEVILALAMVAIVLTSLMMVEGKVFHNVMNSAFKIERFYALRNIFFDVRIHPLKEEETTREKIIEELATKIVYKKNPVHPGSSLARFAGLFQEVSTGSWHEWGQERVYDLVTFQFDPPLPDKEKNDGAA